MLDREEATDMLIVVAAIERPPACPRRRRKRHRGFTLIELIITLVLLGILIAVGLPAFTSMVANAQVRTTAEALQNGVRLARAEALRLNQSTVFSLTNATPAASATAVANGKNWSIQKIPLTGTTDAVAFVQGGALADVASNVTIGSASQPAPAAICFNSNGRLSAPAATGQPGATCTVAGTVTYAVSNGSSRQLNVLVAPGGQVRMCDPLRGAVSASAPDGC